MRFLLFFSFHLQGGYMGKGKDAKKETKKPAAKSLKEKRAEKADKKSKK